MSSSDGFNVTGPIRVIKANGDEVVVATANGDIVASPGEIALPEGNVLVGNSSGVAAALVAKTSGQILVGSGTTVASVAVSGDATLSSAGALTVANNAITTAKILNSNVTLAKLATGITPSHVVKFAGTSPAYGGGGTSTAITVTGAASTDVATAVIRASTNAVSIVKAVLTTDTLTVHFSADPGAATTVDYSVLRAAA